MPLRCKYIIGRGTLEAWKLPIPKPNYSTYSSIYRYIYAGYGAVLSYICLLKLCSEVLCTLAEDSG